MRWKAANRIAENIAASLRSERRGQNSNQRLIFRQLSRDFER
jgi:hypothetical protein